MKVNSESEVAQLCPTLSDPIDCSLPGSSVHGVFQARVLEGDAIAFSRAMLPVPKEACMIPFTQYVLIGTVIEMEKKLVISGSMSG